MADFVKPNGEPPTAQKVINLCKESKLFNRFCERYHIKQVSFDYYRKWYREQDVSKKRSIEIEYRKEIALALLLPFGITFGTAVMIDFTGQMMMTLFVMTIAVLYYFLK